MNCKCGTAMNPVKLNGKPAYVCPKCGASAFVEWHKPESKPYPTNGIDPKDLWIFPVLIVVCLIVARFF